MECTEGWSARPGSRASVRWRATGLFAAVLSLVLLASPGRADAHGPVDPSASSYQARVSQVPAGTDAKVVDGDQRMWMTVAPGRSVVVLDYRGAPYLRFSRGGVAVNHASSMYYLNQVPAQIPPTSIGPRTRPDWHQISDGHAYEWHDGRLHALAATVRAPGSDYAGRWTVPLRVDGAAATITGRLFFAPDPSKVWFWPIVVALASVLAGLRLRRPELDERIARGVAAVALVAFVLAGLERQLHGRPGISAGQLIVLALELAFAGWAATRLVRHRHGWVVFFLVAAAAIWQGATLVGTLLYGYVLLAVPAFAGRLTVVACLASGAALLPLVFAMADRPRHTRRRRAGPEVPGDSTGRDAEGEASWGTTV